MYVIIIIIIISNGNFPLEMTDKTVKTVQNVQVLQSLLLKKQYVILIVSEIDRVLLFT